MVLKLDYLRLLIIKWATSLLEIYPPEILFLAWYFMVSLPLVSPAGLTIR